MPQVKCRICAKEFYVKPYHQKLGGGKYCSRSCRTKSQLRGQWKECSICGKNVWRMPKRLKHSKSGKYFCNKTCQAKWRNLYFVGSKHSNWKGGGHAYRRMLMKHDSPKICSLCKISDVRVLAVHHIDGNHKNNEISNLTWLCHNCHLLVHHYPEEENRFNLILNKLPIFKIIMVPMV